MCTINWLIMLMPVYGERNSLHLAPLRWKLLKVVEQEIVNDARGRLAEIRANASWRNTNSPRVLLREFCCFVSPEPKVAPELWTNGWAWCKLGSGCGGGGRLRLRLWLVVVVAVR